MLHNKYWQACFALAPIISFFFIILGYLLFLFTILDQVPETDGYHNESPFLIFGGLGIFLLFIFLTVLLSLASLVFYIIHAMQNPSLKENNLLLVWILLFVFVGGIGQLIYWIMEILNKKKEYV